jgi:Gluconate 2-dehydrogenase subunit 3
LFIFDQNQKLMHRRNALKKTILLAGTITILPEMLAKALANAESILAAVPATQIELLAELADTIIPTTDTPGAKAAGVHDFIALAVEACFSPQQRDQFWADLNAVEEKCQREMSQSYLQFNDNERFQMMTQLEAMPAKNGQPQFFQVLKELTLHGYFTSEIGATQALNYDPVPGVWIPDLAIDENTKAWTSMF